MILPCIFPWIIDGFPSIIMVKNPSANAGDIRDKRYKLWVGKIPWRKAWQSTPVFLPGESHGQKRLVGYGPWGPEESDMTEVT